MLKKETKISGGKTNNRINIPTSWMEILQLEKGDVVEMKLDIKKKEIKITKKTSSNI